MRILRLLLAVLLLAACGSGGGSGGGTPGPSAAPPIKIMPLGDSITDGYTVPGAYRTALWSELAGTGRRIDFVGSQHGGPAALPDQDHEGHRGLRIDELDADVTKWVNAYFPRIVLIHLGTNDVVQEYQLAGAPERLAKLIDHIHSVNPDADVFVSSLIPLETAAWDANAVAYNAALPALLTAKGAKVHFVDLRAAITVADLQDGVHPSAAGYAKMGKAWATAIGPLLQSL
jgi:lysophospholipase L1-like esterase